MLIVLSMLIEVWMWCGISEWMVIVLLLCGVVISIILGIDFVVMLFRFISGLVLSWIVLMWVFIVVLVLSVLWFL